MSKVKVLMQVFVLSIILSFINSPARANSCLRPYLDAEGIKRTGTINVQILFIKYPDSPKKSKGYTKEWFSMINTKTISDYFQQSSYGKTKIKFKANYSWINMPNDSYSYETYLGGQSNWREIEQNYFRSVLAAADSKVDFNKSDVVWIVSDPDLFPTWVQYRDPQVADGKSLKAVSYNGSDSFLATHELLHTLGLKDLYGNANNGFGSTGGLEQYSIMSQHWAGVNLTGYEKYSLGWMGSKDVICQESGTQKIKLNSLDSKGTKLVLLPLNAQEMLGVEYRKNEKVDKYLGSTGVLVYLIKQNAQASINGTGEPMVPIYFGNKGVVDYSGIKISIKKNNVTISR
jgi:M6 family metalloprotease-like protein